MVERRGFGAGTVISMTVLARLRAKIGPQNFVRLRLHHVTRFPRQVWDPPLSVVKIHPVKKKLHDVQRKLHGVDNDQNWQQPSVPRVRRQQIRLGKKIPNMSAGDFFLFGYKII